MEEFTCDHPHFVKKCTWCMKSLNNIVKESLESKGYVKWGPYKNKDNS